MPESSYHLVLDDSGSRLIDRPSAVRRDGMDHFAMGGILIASDHVEEATARLTSLRQAHGITVPFHSTKMRCRKQEWAWLGAAGEHDRAKRLMADLGDFLCSMQAWATACVIHRPGYEARYAGIARAERWRLCRSAYAIVVERAAKIASQDGRRLQVRVEQAGKREDAAIREYHRTLRTQGMEFDPDRSGRYAPLPAERFSATLFSKPDFFGKASLLGQVADLVLYLLVKGRYEPSYRPYRDLVEAGRLIDARLPPGEVHMGIKYYCFDGP